MTRQGQPIGPDVFLGNAETDTAFSGDFPTRNGQLKAKFNLDHILHFLYVTCGSITEMNT